MVLCGCVLVLVLVLLDESNTIAVSGISQLPLPSTFVYTSISPLNSTPLRNIIEWDDTLGKQRQQQTHTATAFHGGILTPRPTLSPWFRINPGFTTILPAACRRIAARTPALTGIADGLWYPHVG